MWNGSNKEKQLLRIFKNNIIKTLILNLDWILNFINKMNEIWMSVKCILPVEISWSLVRNSRRQVLRIYHFAFQMSKFLEIFFIVSFWILSIICEYQISELIDLQIDLVSSLTYLVYFFRWSIILNIDKENVINFETGEF